jgi:AcrR family transcriptional regulator
MSRKNPLDKSAVVSAAADLLNREGPDALTLNRLAAVVGIRTPSLYNHVDGMPGLMRDLARLNIRALAQHLGTAAIGHSGAEGVLVMAQAYRAYIKENPGLYLASLRASGLQETPDSEQQAFEEDVIRIVLAVLASLGLGGADAIHAARGLRSAIHGFATLEIAGGFGLPLDLDESFARLIGMLVTGMQPARDISRDAHPA